MKYPSHIGHFEISQFPASGRQAIAEKPRSRPHDLAARLAGQLTNLMPVARRPRPCPQNWNSQLTLNLPFVLPIADGLEVALLLRWTKESGMPTLNLYAND
jgi:hypothetical protein